MTSTASCWEVAEAVIGVSKRTLLYGPPGSGKTYTARTASLADGKNVYSITMTPETPMAEIRGHFIQKAGDYLWHHGPGNRAWLGGDRLIINEIDRAGEDVLSFLYAILDDPEFAELTLPTGETIRPAEGFEVVATMNGIPEDLPEALVDRLTTMVHIDELHPGAVATLPEDLREPALNSYNPGDEDRRITLRSWIEFADLREKLDPAMAAVAVFQDRAQIALSALQIAGSASAAIALSGLELTDGLRNRLYSTFREFAKYRESGGANHDWIFNGRMRSYLKSGGFTDDRGNTLDLLITVPGANELAVMQDEDDFIRIGETVFRRSDVR